MPRMHVIRDIQISRPAAELATDLADFRRWTLWSPWLCQEPDATIEYWGNTGEIGSGYSWDGKRVGAGRMHLVTQSVSRLDYSLDFLKPWKSHADVAFMLEPSAEQATRVSWLMDSSLPFFMFFMKRSFEAFIGSDYQRGLGMLKELHETGSIRSELSISGVESLEPCDYISRDGSGSLASLGPTMQAGFRALEEALSAAGASAAGPHFCHYRKMDLVRDAWEFTMGLPVAAGDQDLPGLTRRHRAAIERCAHVVHTGDYNHLGNAWATAFSWMRADKLRHDKRTGGFEIYRDVSDPAGPVTDVFVPLK